MKRIYLKPEIKTLQLRLNTFLTSGSGSGENPTGDYFDDGSGTETGLGEGHENSRYLRKSMWDEE